MMNRFRYNMIGIEIYHGPGFTPGPWYAISGIDSMPEIVIEAASFCA